jgi:uncharacterized membrane protein YeaQ/YmgE (transglycosylase-associated protein family)
LDRPRPDRGGHRQGDPARDDPGGIIVTIIIGIVGAILGGFLAQVLFNRDTVDEFFDISTWLTAIIGAIILLLIYRLASAGAEAGAGSSSPPGTSVSSDAPPVPGGASRRSAHRPAGRLSGLAAARVVARRSPAGVLAVPPRQVRWDQAPPGHGGAGCSSGC